MSSQRTTPASFSRLKEVLPATQPQTAPPSEPLVAEEPEVAAAAVIAATIAAAAAPVAPVAPVVAPTPAPVQQPYNPPAPVVKAPPAPVVQPSAVQQSAIRPRSALAARPGKRLQHTKPATFRLPIELIETLKDVAHHNNLNMTDIVAEAVWLHLDSFEWPNGLDATRELLAAHFAAPARR